MTFYDDDDDREIVEGILFVLKAVCLLLAAGLVVMLVMYHFRPDLAEARPYCYRPAHMITTDDCTRVPTMQAPYCPKP